MHILWVSDKALFSGGAELYIFNTVALLKQAGVSSTLLYDPTAGADQRFLQAFDAAFPLVDLEKQLPQIDYDVAYVHQLDNERALKALIHAQKPVLRFFHDHSLFCLRGHKLALLSNNPCEIPMGCRCYPLGCMPRREGQRFKIATLWGLRRKQKLHQQLSGFIVASHYMAREIEASGFDSDRTHVLPLYAAAAEKQRVSRDPHLLLFVGSLLRGKGVDVALKALNKLPVPFRLVIIGSGRQGKQYRDLAKRLQLQSRVEFIDRIPQIELDLWYQRALCLVVPSRWPEPFGLVGVEAMSFGTPVIATRVGGIDEWLETGVTGLSIPYNDPQALADAVLTISKDQEFAERLGRNAEAKVREKFIPERHLQSLLSCFKSVMKDKFSQSGSPEVESLIQTILADIKETVRRHFSEDSYHSLLLIGGYGKGEGGVERRAGKEIPHNNFDLLLITKGGIDKSSLDAVLAPIVQKYGIGIDTGVISLSKLKRSRSLIIWYDLYHGHRVLLGRSPQQLELPFADVKQIPAEDMLALMINRGTLLIINDWLISRGEVDPRTLLKHLMKAIIGFGDALLFFMGAYHWSYDEKLRRIQQSPAISPEFKTLYEQAAKFRFKPKYEAYENVDLAAWTAEIKPILANIYLQCEEARLGEKLEWSDYVEASLRKQVFRGSLRGYLQPPSRLVGKSLLAKIGFWGLPPLQRLAVAFPYVAFGLGDSSGIKFLGGGELRTAYLNYWGRYGDKNFLQRYEGLL